MHSRAPAPAHLFITVDKGSDPCYPMGEWCRAFCPARKESNIFERYRCNPKVEDVRIRFEVEDPFLEWNNRAFAVRFCRGVCHVEAGEGKAPAHDGAVRLSIGTLTTLLLGYKTAAQLSRIERIGGSEQTVGMLDEALLHIPPYISDYI